MDMASLAKQELLAAILLVALPGAGAPAWADLAAPTHARMLLERMTPTVAGS